MEDLKPLIARIEMLEARCDYFGVVCTAMLEALPDKEVFLQLLQKHVRLNDANSLYATSLSDSQQQLLQQNLEHVERTLRTILRSEDQE